MNRLFRFFATRKAMRRELYSQDSRVAAAESQMRELIERSEKRSANDASIIGMQRDELLAMIKIMQEAGIGDRIPESVRRRLVIERGQRRPSIYNTGMRPVVQVKRPDTPLDIPPPNIRAELELREKLKHLGKV